ncbi:TetR/AcrR family transcriptional regulator [Winogradskyella immobilis]|uniref:TetR/AcrR family transcriptional regulator n=1 Tax=Winogradskyella immobilis TaxID=2816852 RepID=A0ABS8EKY8_9FLAO|nr:TetR/AcrR family transcriptional regulator [Winogradskyella immobilis]MCC1483893.1 TetR/AcrR family transcriptional regulator [Winogradskyella immobilis]MCG0015986.1 TetR/AcrR family transcriptional regulator [Winogradskyella immobilis]
MKTLNRKDEILIVAAKLFKEKGYSAVTMRDLATDMHIKAASLYNHIESKQAILKEIILSISEQFTEGMERIIKLDASSIEKLKKVIRLHVKITSRNTNGMASLNNDWMHLGDQLEYYKKLRYNYEDNFRQIIQNGIDSNEIKNEKLDVLLFSMLSTLRSLYIWIPKKEDINIEELSDSLSEILITGINK